MRCENCPIPADLTCEGEEVRRFCELVDPGHDAYNPAYIRTLWTLARSGADRAKPRRRSGVAEAMSLIRAMKECPFYSIENSCCAGARCGLRRGAVVTHLECFDCLRRYVAAPQGEMTEAEQD